MPGGGAEQVERAARVEPFDLLGVEGVLQLGGLSFSVGMFDLEDEVFAWRKRLEPFDR